MKSWNELPDSVKLVLMVLMFCALALVVTWLATPAKAACPLPPLFDMSGPVCTPERQEIECACSECIAWDPSPDATYYRIYRWNQDGSSGDVGRIDLRPGFIDDDGNEIPPYFPAQWCVAKDVRTPIQGRRYVYGVIPCNPFGCAAAALTVVYRAGPYRCYDHDAGGQVTCPHS